MRDQVISYLMRHFRLTASVAAYLVEKYPRILAWAELTCADGELAARKIMDEERKSD